MTQTNDRRVHVALDTIHRLCLGVLAIVGAVFVVRYRSTDPALWGYSWQYLLAIVGPYGALVAAVRMLRPAPTGEPGALFRLLAALPRWLRPLPGMLFVGIGVGLALIAPEPRVALALLVLSGGVAVQAWSRFTGSPRPLLLSIGPVLAAVVLFAVELPLTLRDRPLVTWGQADCFRVEGFPEQPPFIGPGGRLLPDLDARIAAPEYHGGARLITNGRGLRNRSDFGAAPAPGTTRILSLGDSFATGFCADQDRFFGTLLAARLRQVRPVEVLNAAISDPAYGLRYLQQYGLALQPEIVTYSLCGNDVMQAFWFAGPGRRFVLADGRLEANPEFHGDPVPFFEHFADVAYHRSRGAAGGTSTGRAWPSPAAWAVNTLAGFRLLSGLRDMSLRFRSQPAVTRGVPESANAADRRLRLFDGGANVGFYLQPAPPVVDAMYAVFFDLLRELDRSARRGGARFVLVLFPQRHQVQPADWEVMCRHWNLDPADFDLDLPSLRVKRFCAEHDIECVDLLARFRRLAGDDTLYLPGGDVHFNRRGHAVAAAGVAEYLLQQQLSGP